MTVCVTSVRSRLRVVLTLRTERSDLGFVRGGCKAGQCHAFCQASAHDGIADLGDGPAMGAYDQQIVRRPAGIVACDPSIDGIESMDQARFDQKVQRTINSRGRGARMDTAHGFEQFVSLQAAPFLTQKKLKDLAPDRREATPTLLAQFVGQAQLSADGVGNGAGRSHVRVRKVLVMI